MTQPTRKELIEATKTSIKHWHEDIIERFEKGDIPYESGVISFNLYKWKSNDELLRIQGHDCPLCELIITPYAITERNRCKKCPLEIKGWGCNTNTNAPWRTFKRQPTLKNAQAMVAVLEECLEALEKGEI